MWLIRTMVKGLRLAVFIPAFSVMFLLSMLIDLIGCTEWLTMVCDAIDSDPRPVPVKVKPNSIPQLLWPGTAVRMTREIVQGRDVSGRWYVQESRVDEERAGSVTVKTVRYDLTRERDGKGQKLLDVHREDFELIPINLRRA